MREHKQSWQDVFSCFRIALDARKIILGTLGVYVSLLVIYLLLLASSCPPETQLAFQDALRNPLQSARALCGTIETMACEGRQAHGCLTFGQVAFLGAAGILMLSIWSFFGGAIARIAAIDFAKGKRLEIGEAGAFACKKFGSFFWAPVAPLLFALLFLLCNYVLGLAAHIPWVGPIVVGLLFFLAVLSSFFVVILLIGTLFGLPFMWPTIAMEGTDAFDAVSRSFNYLFARPWKTLWCWLVAMAYGLATAAFVGWFLIFMLRIAHASVGAGMPAEDFRVLNYFLRTGIPPDGTQPFMLVAMVLARMMMILVGGLFLGYIVSFKMTAYTVIYAIIRRDVDGTDMGEAYLPEPDETPAVPAAPQAEGKG